MSNKGEYVRQLVNHGLDSATADKVADAVVATDEGRERTSDQKEAVTRALNQVNR